ncbi:MAG: hypothetical protein WBL61_24580 [Bryobacteraceae bacterium]
MWTMNRRSLLSCAVYLALLPGVPFAQVKGAVPVKTTPCELVAHPEEYNHKPVTVRSPVKIAFEDFSLPTSECTGGTVDMVWLEYGRGPKRQPTMWCCNDTRSRDPLVLIQDKEFRRFDHYITAQKKAEGCYDCYLYHVTASLTGRFDVAKDEPGPLGGFGHMGMAGARLLIHSVSDVVATPIDPSVYEKRQ